MYICKDRTIGVLIVFFGLALLVGSPAATAVECGETLTGGSVRIDHDIENCTENPALTIQGPVNVNFNEFTLGCASAGTTGILITGQNAKVRNGTVLNCEDGIEVTGDGRHQVLKMSVTSDTTEALNRGFRVRSNNNRLVENIVDAFNGDEGFRIEGQGNRLVNNEALNNAGHGFRLRGNGEHQLVNNLAERNGQEGFRLDSDGNRLVNNVAINNGDEGFRVRDGAGNILINNRAEQNGATDGEAGFRVQSDDNLLGNNTAESNVGNGILLYVNAEDGEYAENNQITHNTAHNNGAIDLVDQNPDCDNNVWLKNRYGTRNQDCVD